MNTEHKYYLEKINNLFKDEEVNNLLISYINSDEKINDEMKSESEKDENRKNILKFISYNRNTIFSKNYTQNILNKLDNIETCKENIMNKDLESQQESFKERLKIKTNKTKFPKIKENEIIIIESANYFSENIKNSQKNYLKVKYLFKM